MSSQELDQNFKTRISKHAHCCTVYKMHDKYWRPLVGGEIPESKRNDSVKELLPRKITVRLLKRIKKFRTNLLNLHFH